MLVKVHAVIHFISVSFWWYAWVSFLDGINYQLLTESTCKLAGQHMWFSVLFSEAAGLPSMITS